MPLPDIIAPGLDVLFCGINPGLVAAASGEHFAGRSNRFWRVIHLAGFTDEQLTPAQARLILDYGYGLTTFVQRPTAGADEVTREEFEAAGDAFRKRVARYKPRVVAFLGKAAYASLSNQRILPWGRQSTPIAQSIAWVLPNTSGRNRAFTLDQLVEAYSALREAIGPARD
ncbi:G/U mismatch-specific DNA glycosylase [Bacillus sp. NP157]|nr:G/U mismatch-specific DNA glycosylase [Bacillus sp. NP157]